MIRKRIEQVLKAAMERSKEEGALPPDIEIEPMVEMPREKGHGDYATTISFQLARKARKGPEEIARTLVRNMDAGALCSEVAVAAKGFINFHVRDEVFRSELADILEERRKKLLPFRGPRQESHHRVRQCQPHRAAPHRPRPRCRGGRCARRHPAEDGL